MKITNTEVYGFDAALRGMRNPMNSWHLQDSGLRQVVYDECRSEFIEVESAEILGFIGEKDLDLAQRLIKAGSEHCKFLRQIQVWADFNMPLYWWSEFDTYKFNTKNSCSTMHKLLNAKKGIELSDFAYDELDIQDIENTVIKLNKLRDKYLETKDYRYVIRAKKLLPTSYKQLRTVNTNYAELRNIYFQRMNHRLKEEWQDTFCKWVENLPYAQELILFK